MKIEIKKLKDIGSIFNGNSINERIKRDKYTGKLNGRPFIATKDLDVDTYAINYDNRVKIPLNEKGFKVAHKNSVLICMEGGSAGKKVAFNAEDVYFGNKLVAIEANSTCNPKYLFYYLLSDEFGKAFKDLMNGVIGGVSINKFKEIDILVPSLSEQNKIVKILDEAFEKIQKVKENTEKNLRNSRELFETYLETAFNSNKQKNIRSLIDIATFRNGINFTKNSKGSSVKIVGVKDFQNSFFVPFNTLDSVILNGNLNEDDLLKDGDILVVRSNGNPKLIGRSLFVKGIKDPITHSGFTIRIRLSSKDIDPKLLCYYLKSRKTRHELTESGIGINIKSLSQESLKSLSIEIPGSLSEQKQIVKKLDQLSEKTQKLELLYKQKLENIEELKRSILSKAFSKGL